MQLPTKGEINVHGSLDEKCAMEHFLGKTLEQAKTLFREDNLCYFEDLMWMGPKAFNFYVLAAIDYIKSDASTNDCDAINSFEGILDFRWSYEREELAAILPELGGVVRYILDNWGRFEVDPAIYGDLREKYVEWSRQLDVEPLAN